VFPEAFTPTISEAFAPEISESSAFLISMAEEFSFVACWSASVPLMIKFAESGQIDRLHEKRNAAM
jgi:chitinase